MNKNFGVLNNMIWLSKRLFNNNLNLSILSFEQVIREVLLIVLFTYVAFL